MPLRDGSVVAAWVGSTLGKSMAMEKAVDDRNAARESPLLLSLLLANKGVLVVVQVVLVCGENERGVIVSDAAGVIIVSAARSSVSMTAR